MPDTLKPYEFVIRLDNDIKEFFLGKPVSLEVINPHEGGVHDIQALSMIKVLIAKVNEINKAKAPKELPVLEVLKARVRDITFNTQQTSSIGLQMELYKKGWEEGQK